tara:strand:- start:10896 stop:11219 length:324 start_codon:yes stop_codon:yes gene_type:complete
MEDSLERGCRLKAEAHAYEEFPKEACGLIVAGAYFPCVNIADEPELDFVLNPVDYLKAMQTGKIEAVVHSHPKGGGPSAFDLKSCKQTKLRWYVFSVPDSTWKVIEV